MAQAIVVKYVINQMKMMVKSVLTVADFGEVLPLG